VSIRLFSLSLAGLLVAAIAAPAAAAPTREWRFASPADFRAGTFEGLVVGAESGLRAAPSLKRLDVEAELIHCWARVGDDVWLGTGLEGRIFRVHGKTVTKVADIDSTLVASLADDGDDGVYAGGVGNGKIWRVTRDGKVNEIVKIVGADHIFALVRDGETLYAGTGPGGKVFRVKGGKADVWFETGADHVLSLSRAQGRLLAGTGGEALVFEVTGAKEGRAIARFDGAEVRSLLVDGDALYASVNGGPTAAPLSSLKPTPARPGGTPAAPPVGAPPPAAPIPPPKKPGGAGAAGGAGAVWKVDVAGRVDRVLTSPEGMVTEVTLVGGRVVAGTARSGRVVRQDADGDAEVLFDLSERQVLGLVTGKGGLRMVLTGQSAAVYLVGEGSSDPVFTTKELDAGAPATWGRLHVESEGKVKVETRSGWSSNADQGWSGWEKLDDGKVASPRARYLQIRARLGSDTVLRELQAFYTPLNRAPLLSDVKVGSAGPLARPVAGTPVSTKQSITWRGEDPDGDTLVARLWYRAKGGGRWAPVVEQPVAGVSYAWETDGLPDGEYEVRVEVSDEKDNALGEALKVARTSRSFLIDRSRPQIESFKLSGRRLRATLSDGAGRIDGAELSVDGGPFLPLRPADGLFDARSEKLDVALPPIIGPGPHVFVLRVWDQSGNAAGARIESPVE